MHGETVKFNYWDRQKEGAVNLENVSVLEYIS